MQVIRFKKLELVDKEIFREFTCKFPPYSDFDFTSLFVWDIRNTTEWAFVNGNLAILLDDYISGQKIFSLLGKNDLDFTIKLLLQHVSEVGADLNPALYLIPEVVATSLIAPDFYIEEDLDNFDYIYDLGRLSTLSGNRLNPKKREARNFALAYPNYRITDLDLKYRSVQGQVLSLYDSWLAGKLKKGVDPQADNEKLALKKLLAFSGEFDLTALGLFVDEKMVAFAIDESLVDSEYIISHFFKYDESFIGASAFLLQQSSKSFFQSGKKWFNYEQDLGRPELREGKKRFCPSFFLKKYKVGFKNLTKK